MSAATAVDATPKKGSKKLILILAIVGLLLVVGGGGAAFMLKQRAAAAAAAEEDGEEVEAAHAPAKKRDPKYVPTFVALDPFVVNLADREQERYAQIGVTLEVDDAKVAEELKAYMPAIRNGVLMVLAHKTSAELLERAGKEKLAGEIMREAVRPLGIELEDGAADEAADDKPAKKKKRKAAEHNPVQQVLFSSFIIQ
ncbi:flagellar basal body-associated FliL family protein [Caldimonas sp. KR1-144]|uniref:flagellar basal body-associated FliL family protein n=1 Tax=Caldimonas sp. KR1-144 TaxID=3400911 RepID=UPI003C0F5980